MNERIKNLLPNDSYVIQMHHSCSSDYVLALTHLYQPLIGLKAVSLYLTLLNESKLLDGPTTHHTIMNMTNLDLDQFYQSRLKLEAIGLIRTYVEEGNIRTYYYVLQAPFSVKHFFEDSMLSILLEHHVGKVHVDRLKEKLLPEHIMPVEVIEKTKAFDQVFSTIQTKTPQLKTQVPPTKVKPEETIDVDFEWIEHALRQNKINPSSVLSRENKKFINNLVKIYHIDNLALEKAILWSINDGQVLVQDELHEACKDYYARNFQSTEPKLVAKQEFKDIQKPTSEPKTKEEKLILHFERITHRELLEDFSKTGYASENEIKMLTNIMLKHGLPQSVMNVLVHYCMQKSDMKLSRNYVEKIATHWSRKNVQNAKQAIALAKSESKLYQSWGTKRNTAKKKEVLPEWFQNDSGEKGRIPKATEQNRDILKEKQELERALKNVSKS